MQAGGAAPRSGPGGRWMRVLVFAFAAVLSFGFLLFPSSIAHRGTRILLETEQGQDLGAPLEVVEDPAEPQTTFVHFPPVGGNPEAPQALARKPRFAFKVPTRGVFSLWARARWKHVCANSIQVNLDGGPPLLIGNEEEFGHWHWVRHDIPVPLEGGAHELIISAAESDVDVDRILLSDDPNPVLPGSEVAGFVDDFTQGIPSAWSPLSPSVSQALRGPGTRQSLRFATSDGETLKYVVRSGSAIAGDLYLGVRGERMPGSAEDPDVALVFDHRDGDHYRFVRVSRSGVYLGSMREGLAKEALLADASPEILQFISGQRAFDLDLLIEGGVLGVWQRGRLLASAPFSERIEGEAGVGSRRGSIDVERIEGRVIGAPHLQNGFYNDNRLLGRVDGFEVLSGNWRRGHIYSAPITYPLEARAEEGRAIAITGERWWRHYRFSTAIRIHADAWAELVFQYRDADDYRLLRVRCGGVDGRGGEMQILERKDGKERVLRSVEVVLPRDRWRVIGIDLTQTSISGSLDGKRALEIPASDDVPGPVGLAVETASDRESREIRPPVFFLDKDTEPPFSFRGPLKVDQDDPGAVQLFLYQDSANFYRCGAVRNQDTGALEAVLERFRSGRLERISSKPLRFPRTDASGSPFAAGLDLAVTMKEHRIETFFYDKPFAIAEEASWSGGRMGVQDLRPASHVDFDEVRVTPPETAVSEPGMRLYAFNPAIQAARDLAEWETVSGEWGIGIFDNGFLYALLGRTGTSGRAVMQNRFPLEGDLRALNIGLRTKKLAPCRMDVVLEFPDSAKTAKALDLRLELAPATDGTNVRPLVRLLWGDQEVAHAEVEPWSELQWRDLGVQRTAGGKATVSLDERRVLEAPWPGTSKDGILRLSLMGAEGTVFGVKYLKVDARP